MKLTELRRPFICVDVWDSTPEEAIRTIKISEADGADAFSLQLGALDKRYLSSEGLEPIFSSTDKPIYTAYRRYDLHHSHASLDEEYRISSQLEALKVGSLGLDMEMDAFTDHAGPPPTQQDGETFAYLFDEDSPPREVSEDPNVVKRQIKTIEQVHKMGGEVLLSTHTQIRVHPKEAVRLGKLAEERGADMVKIVSWVTSHNDLIETFQATLDLKENISIPFLMMGTLEHSKLSRIVCPMLGSMMVLCAPTYVPGGFMLQPLVRNARQILLNADWSVAKTPEQVYKVCTPGKA